MAIDGALRKQLTPGIRLVAKYKGAEHTAEVVAGNEGKLRFRLADGRQFESPSAAGSAVMGGIACNGWRFWSLADERSPKPEAKRAQSREKAPAKQIEAEP